MNADLLKVLLLLAAAIVMFAVNRPRADAVALLAMTALPFTGVVEVGEAIAGFADPNIVLIAAMFVIGEALARTGVAQRVGDWLATHGGDRPWRQLGLLMAAVGLLGAVMSSTGVVAMFIPVVLRICERSRVAPGRLMMPMAYAALISGMMTLVATSSNLVINQELIRRGSEGFAFFAFTPFGVPILLLSMLYLHAARRWLRADALDEGVLPSRPKLKKWVGRYRLAEREFRVRVLPGSPLLHRPIEDLDFGDRFGMRLVLVERGSGRNRQPLPRSPRLRLQAGDVLLLDLDHPVADAAALCAQYRLDPLPLSGRYFVDRSRDVGMVEVVLPDDSRFAGKTVAEAEGLGQAALAVVGVRRGKTVREPVDLRERRLKLGDTLLMAGPWPAIRRLQQDSRDVLVLNLPHELGDLPPAADKAPLAILTLGVVVALMATGIVPNVQAALIGCLMMGLFGCIGLDQGYRSIQLKSLLMIVGMMPFALALERAGGVDIAARALVALSGDSGSRTILALLFGVTIVLGLFIVNTANAVLMIPVALAVADELHASPYPFAMTVALAASAAFMTPISPINTLVASAGNYGFADFIRIGLPLTLIVLAVTVLMVPWILPL